MEFYYLMLGFAALFGILHLPPVNRLKPLSTSRDRGAVVLALFFVLAGVIHFLKPEMYAQVMPAYIPKSAHMPLVLISGVFEILGGIGVLLKSTRRAAGWGLTALLIAVFPVNIDMAVHGVHTEGLPREAWVFWVRLPFQVLFIVWALWCSNALNRKPRAKG